MMRSLAAKARLGLLGNTTIEAQAAGSHQRVGMKQGGRDLSEHGGNLLVTHQGTQAQRVTQFLNRQRETDAIGVQPWLSVGRVQHQALQRIMGQHDGVELLQAQEGQSTAQGRLAQAQMILGLVNHQFDFPSLVIEQHEI